MLSAKVVFFEALTDDFTQKILFVPHTSLFILADKNTAEFCYPLLPDSIKEQAKLIVIPHGEENKNISTCEHVWLELEKHHADRKSLLINLGGGIVTDLGGFAASIYKRGIKFIHIPTTLMGMADAAHGGKAGINFHGLKNEIGLLSLPEMIIIYTGFLKTLAERITQSAFAEIIKYELLSGEISPLSAGHFSAALIEDREILNDAIEYSIKHKKKITDADFSETGLRKTLNLGHTTAHTLEALYIHRNKTLLHGEAVAAGLIVSLFLSHKKFGLSHEYFHTYLNIIQSIFPKVEFAKDDIPYIIDVMKSDKKNENAEVRFVLLNDIGKPVTDVAISADEIREALAFYLS